MNNNIETLKNIYNQHILEPLAMITSPCEIPEP